VRAPELNRRAPATLHAPPWAPSAECLARGPQIENALNRARPRVADGVLAYHSAVADDARRSNLTARPPAQRVPWPMPAIFVRDSPSRDTLIACAKS
jgi:hypothetical protein